MYGHERAVEEKTWMRRIVHKSLCGLRSKQPGCLIPAIHTQARAYRVSAQFFSTPKLAGPGDPIRHIGRIKVEQGIPFMPEVQV